MPGLSPPLFGAHGGAHNYKNQITVRIFWLDLDIRNQLPSAVYQFHFLTFASTTEVKNACNSVSTPQYDFMFGPYVRCTLCKLQL
jgi:hypothetical protein